MANDDLRPLLKSVNETIANVLTEIQNLTGEVQKIPEIIREATENIRDAIHENIRAQAELKLMEHLMEVKTIEPQIEAEYEQIEAERSELEERIESIDQRYEERHQELDRKARDRVRNLGEHIFKIDEEQFDSGIEEPFTEQVTTAWQQLQTHNVDVTEQRSTVVQETVSDAIQSIHDYIDRQDQLIDTIQNHRLDPDEMSLPSDESEPLQIPYYVVIYEQDGIRQTETIVPSQLGSGDSTWCDISLNSIDGAENLMENVGRVRNADDQTSLTRAQIESALYEYSGSSKLGPSYAEALSETLPDHNSIAVELEASE